MVLKLTLYKFCQKKNYNDNDENNNNNNNDNNNNRNDTLLNSSQIEN